MAEMKEPVIVDAVRTPVGKRGKALGDWHPTDLLAHTLSALVDRTGLDPEMVDDVIAGCVRQVGEQSMNIARNAVLGAGFPESVPATTIDRQCGSSQQAAHFAAQGIMSGAYEVAVACGVESMTRVPLGEAFEVDGPMGPWYGGYTTRRYDSGLVNQGISAEKIAKKWKLGREELDEFSVESHRRADLATEEGRFEGQILPVPVRAEDGSVVEMVSDEGIRKNIDPEKMASLEPVFDPEGVITAGNSSQISDAAAALLIMERGVAERLGLRPRARFVSFALAGVDPIYMLTGPVPATHKVLERADLVLDDIDLFEINEAFACIPLMWQRETGADMEKTNVNGGSVAIGHPVGSTGARLMTVLLNELERTGGRYGLQAMCEGGGQANGTIIERLD
jgi:acetyl-CoA acetyltransferase family protein